LISKLLGINYGGLWFLLGKKLKDEDEEGQK
jgi:hypothetical protein